ncbi:AraC family transcriptional regulator [Paenibacillus rhizoplanae]
MRDGCSAIPSSKIYDVARLSGHQSPKHFMLVFKQQTGVTAGEYRNQFNH